MTEEKAAPKPAGPSGGSILEIKLPKVLPVLPLRSTVLFPMSMTPLTIAFRRSSTYSSSCALSRACCSSNTDSSTAGSSAS